MNPSLTIVGVVVAIIGRLGENLGVQTDSVTTHNIEAVVLVGMQVIGIITAIYGRFRQGDITWYGTKK